MTKLAYDIIDFTLNQKPENVATTFADMVNAEIADRIDAKREEIQQTMFNEPEPTLEDDLSDEEVQAFLDSLTPEEIADLEKEIEENDE